MAASTLRLVQPGRLPAWRQRRLLLCRAMGRSWWRAASSLSWQRLRQGAALGLASFAISRTEALILHLARGEWRLQSSAEHLRLNHLRLLLNRTGTFSRGGVAGQMPANASSSAPAP